MNQATLKQVKAVALKFGAKVEDEKIGDCHRCMVEAPHGFIWAEGDVHELVDETNRPWKPDYTDMLNRMKYGIRECPNRPHCDWYDEEEVG